MVFTEPIPFLPEKPYPEPSVSGVLAQAIGGQVDNMRGALAQLDGVVETAVGRKDGVVAAFGGWTLQQQAFYAGATNYDVGAEATEIAAIVEDPDPSRVWLDGIPLPPNALTTASPAASAIAPWRSWWEEFKTYVASFLSTWGWRPF